MLYINTHCIYFMKTNIKYTLINILKYKILGIIGLVIILVYKVMQYYDTIII